MQGYLPEAAASTAANGAQMTIIHASTMTQGVNLRILAAASMSVTYPAGRDARRPPAAPRPLSGHVQFRDRYSRCYRAAVRTREPPSRIAADNAGNPGRDAQGATGAPGPAGRAAGYRLELPKRPKREGIAQDRDGATARVHPHRPL